MSLASTDLSIAAGANRLAQHHDGWEDLASAYATASEALFLAAVVALIVAGMVLRRPRLAVAGGLAVAASGLALVVGHLVSLAVDRPRPFVAHPQIHLFARHAADASFPSDHATAAFAIAGVLVLWLGRRAAIALVAAVALAVSRVAVGLHYPGDVLAGAALGLACAAVVCRAARTFRRRSGPARQAEVPCRPPAGPPRPSWIATPPPSARPRRAAPGRRPRGSSERTAPP
jgi:undecaprenyl-diphosphatase